MSNININTHIQFLDTSHLLFLQHVLLGLEKTPPFSSSGSLETASIVLSFRYFMCLFSLFHETSLMVSHTPLSEIMLSWWVCHASQYDQYSVAFSIFPVCLNFSGFVQCSQGLWEKGCHFVLLVQCLAD